MSQQINLFNPVFLRQEKYFSAIAGMQAIGLLILGMLGFYAYAVFEVDGQTRQISSLDRQERLARERQVRVNAEFGAKPPDAALGAQVKDLQRNIAAHETLLNALNAGGFGSERGLAEYMRALARQAVRGLWLTGFSVEEGGANFSISGLALTADLVPAFVRGLGVEKSMQGRTMDNLAMSSQQFALTLPRMTQPVQVPVVAFVLSSGMGSSGVPEREEGLSVSPPAQALGGATPDGAKPGN